MKINFRKIASVLSSAVMVSSTVALAAAASYPAPFVKGGAADVAVVYGSAPGAQLDLAAVVDVTKDLQYQLARQTAVSSGGTTTVSTTGETAALFEGSSKIYANDSLNAVKSSLTKSNLPTVLVDGSFSGNVDATFTQRIDIGTNPALTFAKQPTSSDDPSNVISLGTNGQTQYVYNSTVTFNKEINFTHADSKGGDLTIFGQKFTVAASTDGTNLVLLKTAQKIALSSDSPSTTVTIGDKEYTVELVSASDTAATIKVTDSAGVSETKEVNENASKKIQGITVAVTNADETNLKLSASVIAGAEKVTLSNGNAVQTGEDNKNIDGTTVTFSNSTDGPGRVSWIRFSVAAIDSDHDAIRQGEAFTDPVFKAFKLDFSAGLNIWANSSSREEIKFTHTSDDKMQIKFNDHRAKEATQIWARANSSAGSFAGLGIVGISAALQGDNDGRNITVFERAKTYKGEYVVVGNENSGHLVKVATISNATSGTGQYADDKVEFTDVFSGDKYTTSITADGTGSVVIGGKSYGVQYGGNSSASADSRWVRLNYPDSSGAGSAIIYPTIQTSKGAKIMFVKPMNITPGSWDGADYATGFVEGGGNNLSTLRIPNGNGYTDVTVASGGTGNATLWNFTVGSTTDAVNAIGAAGVGAAAAGSGQADLDIGTNRGLLHFNISSGGAEAVGNGALFNTTLLIRLETLDGVAINDPAIVIFEEKDDNSDYHFQIVTLEPGATGDDGLGISSVTRSFSPSGNDSGWSDTLASNSKVTRRSDLFGSIITYDDGDSDQRIATISYPDEQIWAQIYVAKTDAAISGGGASGGGGTVTNLGSVSVADNEVGSVSGKNLIVVGGSCVNSLAASLLGGALCGSAFEQKTGVGAGSFLIQTFDRSGGKVATLVAGYNAPDTSDAVKAFITDTKIDTAVGKKFVGNRQSVAMVDVVSA